MLSWQLLTQQSLTKKNIESYLSCKSTANILQIYWENIKICDESSLLIRKKNIISVYFVNNNSTRETSQMQKVPDRLTEVE